MRKIECQPTNTNLCDYKTMQRQCVSMCISPLHQDRKLYRCSSPTSCFSNLWSSSVASAPLRGVLQTPLSQSGIGIFHSLGRSNSTCLCQHHNTADWTGGRGKNTLTQAIKITQRAVKHSKRRTSYRVVVESSAVVVVHAGAFIKHKVGLVQRFLCRCSQHVCYRAAFSRGILRTCLHSQETG